MKYLILLLTFISISFLSCKEKKTVFTGTVNFETIEISRNSQDLNVDHQIDYDVSIKYHQPTDGPGYLRDSINRSMELFFARWLKVPADEHFNLSKAVVDNMQAFIEHVKKDIPKEDCATCRTFELQISGDPIYQNSQVVSLAYNWYVYEGGAHGNYAKWCSMFDKKDGSKISYARLVKDEEKLLGIAEKVFRSQVGMAEEEDMYQLYSFKNDRFHLSDDFIFSTEGLVFFYNPYEIAPYAAGIIEVKLPYKGIAEYINFLD